MFRRSGLDLKRLFICGNQLIQFNITSNFSREKLDLLISRIAEILKDESMKSGTRRKGLMKSSIL